VDVGVGATLRDARNRRKIDLAEVEATTKIRARYLRAIENEEWDLLPGDAYARGFVRTYASYLGLDAERLVEQHRRGTGATRPTERLPRVDSAPVAGRRERPPLPSPSPRLLAVLVSVALITILVAVGLLSGGGGSQSRPSAQKGQQAGRGSRGHDKGKTKKAAGPKALSLRLTATADVWVCLLDGKGRRLVDGQILAGGSEAGPFRSGSFTFSLGNGEVKMTVDGEQENIPATSSPVGYRIDHSGKLVPLSEGERPTCT
jgi:hypothetical protein